MSDFFEEIERSKGQVEKAIMSNVFSTEILEKGKRAEIGEVRTWGGYKYQKTASGWVPFKEGSKQEKEVGDLGDKAAIKKRIKEIESEQDQIEEITQENLLAIFKEELGPGTDVKFVYPGERAEIYFDKSSWASIIVKYSHLDRFSGNAGERKFGISVGVGSGTIEPGSSNAKIISFANKLLTDTGLSDKVKSEFINYQEAGHKLFKEYRELALKLREVKN